MDYEGGLLRTKPWYYVGLDLGKMQDSSAIVVVERAELRFLDRNPLTMAFREETRFGVRWVERVQLGSPYPEVVERVRELVRRAPVAGAVKVIADATGVGEPVVDLLKRAGLGCAVIPVVITSGERASDDGERHRVPKRDLLVGLQVAFQKRRLRIGQEVPGVDRLMEELRGMRVRPTAEGYERIEGARRDDLVLALALAWWKASREAGWGG